MNKEEMNQLADEIAEETFKVFSNKHGEDLKVMETRMEVLKKMIDDHIRDFKTVAVEVERMVTEKYEELYEKDEEKSVQIMEEIQKIREDISDLKIKMNQIKIK